MTPTPHAGRRLRRIGVVASGAMIVAACFAAVAPSAQADDTFTPVNLPSVPTVAIQSVPSPLQPAYPRSTTTYTVTATVSNADGFSAIDNVQMCWYLDGGVCDPTGSDPRSSFFMNYNVATDSFSVAGTNNYLNVSSSTTTLSSTSRDVNFSFKISDAMLASETWDVEVRAYNKDIDGNDQYGSDLATNKTVNYFGYATTGRTGVAFGSILEGSASSVTTPGNDYGSFIANDISSLSALSTDFTHTTGGTVDDTLALTSISPPASGSVRFFLGDNRAGLIVSGTPGILYGNTGIFEEGTGETPQNLSSSAQVEYGGGAKFPGEQYSATVTIAIGRK